MTIEETLVKMRKNFAEIPFREESVSPDIVDVVTCVNNTLLHLDPEMYSIEYRSIGENHTFTVYKQGQLFGRYSIAPSNPGKPTWNKSDENPGKNLELSQEWEFIWLLIWSDLAQRFGRWPWTQSDQTRSTSNVKNGNNEYDFPPEFRSDQKSILVACIDWVYRPESNHRSLQEFLDDRFGGYHTYNAKTFYKSFLPKAAKLGLIKKEGRFYRPAEKNRQAAIQKINEIFEP